jgi:hypothetical protein
MAATVALTRLISCHYDSLAVLDASSSSSSSSSSPSSSSSASASFALLDAADIALTLTTMLRVLAESLDGETTMFPAQPSCVTLSKHTRNSFDVFFCISKTHTHLFHKSGIRYHCSTFVQNSVFVYDILRSHMYIYSCSLSNIFVTHCTAIRFRVCHHSQRNPNRSRPLPPSTRPTKTCSLSCNCAFSKCSNTCCAPSPPLALPSHAPPFRR